MGRCRRPRTARAWGGRCGWALRRSGDVVISLRPSGFDELGLQRALSDRMLPLLVAAMAFLAALATAGWFGSAALARHWQHGAGASLTVQVPQPSGSAGAG